MTIYYKILEALQGILRRVCAVSFAVMIILVGISVICRYILNNSIVWVEEVIRFSFIWIFFLSMPEVTRFGTHVSLDLLPQTLLHGRPRKILLIAIEIICDVFFIFLIYYGVVIAKINMAQVSPALGIPYGLIYFAIPVGSLLMLLNSVPRIRDLYLEPLSEKKKKTEKGAETPC